MTVLSFEPRYILISTVPVVIPGMASNENATFFYKLQYSILLRET
jgi:hypothetical protein